MKQTHDAIRISTEWLEDGTLYMPDLAFKIFVFLLLRAVQGGESASGNGRRTVQVSFFAIVNACDGESDPQSVGSVTHVSIARALAWLEAFGYIERMPGGWQQTITIPDFDRYVL